jgi:hypothetical protein
MALTNQPYIPLYVRDWLTSNKLKMCSLSAQGLMINLMCIMHKEDQYGTLLLKQNFKHHSDICLNFASYLARLLPFSQEEIAPALYELINEKVIYMDDDSIYCNRMIEDARLSTARASSGSKGGKSTTKKNKDKSKRFATDFAQAKIQANAEYENEDANENEFATAFAEKK